MRKAFPPPGIWAATVATLALAAGCGSSSATVSAPTLLQKARQAVDAASAVHFTLTSSGVDTSNTNLVNGSGDIARPNQIQGTFGVSLSGFVANVKVASVGGVFEALLPLQTKYEKANPSSLGLKNPAELLDPDNGLVKLLTLAQNPKSAAPKRINGEVLDTVTYEVPGSDIPVLPDDNPTQPVHLTVTINPSNYQLRTVTLIGPLTSASSNSTYVVTLTGYDEHVTITLPPTG